MHTRLRVGSPDPDSAWAGAKQVSTCPARRHRPGEHGSSGMSGMYEKKSFCWHTSAFPKVGRLNVAFVALALALVMSLGAGVTFAQSTSSSIIGTVTDESGAAIPGASVAVTNVGTQDERTVETNERGDYAVPALDIGLYEVAATMEGFSRAVATDVRLEVDLVRRQNLDAASRRRHRADHGAGRRGGRSRRMTRRSARSSTNPRFASCRFRATAIFSAWRCSLPA